MIHYDDLSDKGNSLLNEARNSSKWIELALFLIDCDFPLTDIREFLKKELNVRKRDFDNLVKMYL